MAMPVIDVIAPAVPVIDVVIAPGPAGPPGPQGPPGPPGAAPAGTGFVKVTNGMYDAPSLNVSAGSGLFDTSISIGTNPAQSGAIRLANNGTLTWRTSDNAQNIDGVKFDDSLQFRTYGGSGFFFNGGGRAYFSGGLNSTDTNLSAFVAIGTNPAQSGAVRLANNQAITARNGENSADLELAKANASNQVFLGSLAGQTNIDSSGAVALRAANNTAIYSCNQYGLWPGSDGTLSLGHSTARFTEANVSQSVNIGTNPAQSGTIRLANASVIAARTAANTADATVLAFSNGDQVIVGDAAFPARIRTSLALPASLANGDWWVDVTGTSPSRIAAIKIRDGGSTRTIASITY